MFTTYILYSKSTGKYYSGHCEDFELRLAQHNGGRNKSTKSGIPWEVIYKKLSESRSAAMALEQKIKKRGAKRFLSDQYNQSG
jgi:putative endonuclease